MEDDVQETPLPCTGSEMDSVKHAGRENTPTVQTTPRFHTSGSAPNAVASFSRSLYGAEDVSRRPYAPLGSTDDSEARLHDVIFPGVDSGFAIRGSASEQTGGEKEQDEVKWRARDEDRQSVELQLGRRLRAIGDSFQRERVRRFVRYRREWEEICWHLATMLFIFLYPREFVGN